MNIKHLELFDKLGLRNGSENAKSCDIIVNQSGFQNRRDVSHAIAQLRKSGVIILSTTGKNPGYYLPSDEETIAELEIRRFVASMMSRIKHIRMAVRSAEKYLKNNGSTRQITMVSSKDYYDRVI